MALDAIVRDPTSGIGAAVDAAGQLQVALAGTGYTASGVKVLGMEGQPLLTARDGHLIVGLDNIQFYEQVDGVAINTLLWQQSVSTMTITQAASTINLNAGLITTASTYALITSVKSFPLIGTMPLVVHFGMLVNVTPQANATIEIGLGTAVTNTAPTDGVFFRWSPSGSFVGVMNYNGTETVTPAITAPAVNIMTGFSIVIDNDDVMFFVDSTLVAILDRPASQVFPMNDAHQNLFARVYTGGTPPATAPRLQIGYFTVFQTVLNMNQNWATALAGFGRGSHNTPTSPYAQTSSFANSATPASATLSNTAAGYPNLGGRFQFAAPAGAATDFALFAFQVPAKFQLYITKVSITAINTGAAVATTATILDWGIAVNSSAVSLATGDSATTWAPHRIALGMMGFVVADPIGRIAAPLDFDFDPPLVAEGNRYVHIILQVPVGTATPSQIIRGSVAIHGYFI